MAQSKSKNYLQKIREKKWSEPLGQALSVTASISNKLSATGVPFAGIVGGAAKIGSSVLNPAPSLADLKRMQQEIEVKMQESTGIVRKVLEKELDALKESIQAPQTELLQNLSLIKTEIQSSANEIVNEIDRRWLTTHEANRAPYV